MPWLTANRVATVRGGTVGAGQGGVKGGPRLRCVAHGAGTEDWQWNLGHRNGMLGFHSLTQIPLPLFLCQPFLGRFCGVNAALPGGANAGATLRRKSFFPVLTPQCSGVFFARSGGGTFLQRDSPSPPPWRPPPEHFLFFLPPPSEPNPVEMGCQPWRAAAGLLAARTLISDPNLNPRRKGPSIAALAPTAVPVGGYGRMLLLWNSAVP